MPDITVEPHGTLVLLHGKSSDGDYWLEEHLNPNLVRYVRAYVVTDPRYVADLVQEARADGLEVA